MKLAGVELGLVRKAAQTRTTALVHLAAQKGVLVKIFSSWVLLVKARGHDLETGGDTARIALEPCKFLKIKVP